MHQKQTSQPFNRPQLPPDSGRNWNDEYQFLCDKIARNAFEVAQKREELSDLINEFALFAHRVGEVIVYELFLDD